jgi:hypothetical protein
MVRPAIIWAGLFLVMVNFSLIGCAGEDRGTLNIVEKPTESELQQDWKDYTVYYRRNLALVYKIKDDRKIILDSSWVNITSDEAMENSQIMDSAWVMEIIGQNSAMFGYLVQRNHDRANIKIIDQNTVQIFYHFHKDAGR